MKKINRRHFLGVSLAGVMALGGFYVSENQYKDFVVSILRRKLSYLDLTNVDLQRFAAEFVGDRGSSGRKGQLLALAYPIIGRFDFLNLRREETEALEDEIVSKFLLSTDFFWNAADTQRAIEYRGYNNPQRNPCGNPFALFD